jgi:predicted regulator of Ras-like GTPase activity (Roadblock/LC7/MglB family)
MALSVVPDSVATAASQLTRLLVAFSEANAAAATPTTSIPPAAADEVSQAIAALFGSAGQLWQELAAQAEQFQAQFAQLLTLGGRLYQGMEDANAESMMQRGAMLVDGQIVQLPVWLQPVRQGQDLLHLYWGGGWLP